VGEGPSYDPETDFLWWFDISGAALYEHRFAEGRTRRHELPDWGSVLARTDGAAQLVAMGGGLWLRDIRTGALTEWVALNGGGGDDLFTNDGRVHPGGALWISSMSRVSAAGKGTIYHVRGREVRPLYHGLTAPNSIAFTADGTTAFWCDSEDGRIMAVATDPATGLPVAEARVFHDGRVRPGAPDGAVVDRHGTLWSARWGAGVVEGIGPDGRLLRQVAFPVLNLACPVFIGARGTGMAVTSGFWGAAKGTDDGATFVVDGGFEGRHDAVFRLGPDAPS
jgi:sugar lactone lactonase